jgi:transcriptional regulator with XRE-family HTH domain
VATPETNTTPQFHLGDRLRKALDHSSTSVQAMADELGVSRTTVSNYIALRTKPNRATLRVWALRCGVPFDWLAHGTEHPNDPNTQVSDDSSCNPPFADVRGISDHIRDRRARRRTIRKKAS